jgi:phage shock protein PspC (stress-responsive transcriptional regulator)
MNKKLYRDEYHKVLGGVCAGLAEYFEMDVTVLRLLFAFTFFIMGVGFGTYIILWIVLPKKGYMFNGFNNPTVDYTVPPQQPEGFREATPRSTGYSGTAYSSQSFQNNPFKNKPFQDNVYNTPKPRSNAGIIAGTILIIIGGLILFDNYDLIPDIDYENLWPVVLVLVGAALIASGQKNHYWHKDNLKSNNNPDNTNTNSPAMADDATIVEP